MTEILQKMMLSRKILLVIVVCAVMFSCSASVFAQSGNVWGTTPVFDGGRVMPLNSFSKRIVREICGSSRPFIVRDDTILTELNRIIESQPQKQNNQGNFDPENIDPTSNNEKPESYRFLIGGSDLLNDFDTRLSGSHEATPEQLTTAALAIHGITVNQAELIYQRIRVLLPPEGRYFDADELLLSWLGEPEIWDYIPIFPAAETDYRTEVLEIPLANNTRAGLQRVAVFQLKQSQRFQQRLADIERRRMQRLNMEVPIRYDQITERINAAMTLYQELTFHPQRLRPTRMIDILQQTIDFSAEQHSSFAFVLESWGHLLELGEIPARQSIQPNIPDQENENESEHDLHPTTQQWHEIVREIRLLAGAFDRINEYGEMVPPNLNVVEKHFEHLLKMIDENFEESLAVMESVYPSAVFRRLASETNNPKTINPATNSSPANNSEADHTNSNHSNNSNHTDINRLLPLLHSPENKEHNKQVIRRIALNYYYAIKTLRRDIETAYLALYDNGESLRVLPVAALSALGDSSNVSPSVQPWGTMQMVLFGGDNFIRRFFNQDFQRKTSASSAPIPDSILAELAAIKNIVGEPTNDKESLKFDEDKLPAVADKETSNTKTTETEEKEIEEKPEELAEEKQWEQELFTGNEFSSFFLSQTRSSAEQSFDADSISRVRADFINLLTAYTLGGRNRSINEAAAIFQESLRNAASLAENLRGQFVDSENTLMSEYVRKTSYPQRGLLNTEYRYQRLAPFFWMWVFAAGAVVLTGISLFLSKIRQEMIDDSLPQKDLPEQLIPLPKMIQSHSPEEFFFWSGIVLLCFSILITFIGGILRAWITGWAPITNMYETIVLMAFSAAIFGLWYSLYPLIHPVIQLSWRSSSIPDWRRISTVFHNNSKKGSVSEQSSVLQQAASDFGLPGGVPIGMQRQDSPVVSEAERRERLNQSVLFWQLFLFVPRLILMLLTFLFVVNISYGDYVHEHGMVAAVLELLRMNDFID
ncbi:MAG: hypothetical protein LBP87_13890, partial [Planctomycetaceae bacterium]|nr:hypothetical protein [Planctomycetaceae bacterium]